MAISALKLEKHPQSSNIKNEKDMVKEMRSQQTVNFATGVRRNEVANHGDYQEKGTINK